MIEWSNERMIEWSNDLRKNFGISFFHLNRAKQSLTGDNNVRLKRKINFHSSLYCSINNTLLISPKIFYSKQHKDNEAVFALDSEYLLKGDKKIILKSGFSYRWTDAIIYNFGVKIDNLEGLISYDFNTSSLSEATNNKGGFEFVFVYIWDIKQKEKVVEPKQCPKYL